MFSYNGSSKMQFQQGLWCESSEIKTWRAFKAIDVMSSLTDGDMHHAR